MEVMEIVYLVCFFLGLGFAVVSGLLSGVFGGHDADTGHPSVGGHDAHFSPWSPVVIAMFIATFGGTGIILRKLGMSIWGQVPIAGASGLIIALLTFYLFMKIMRTTQASSQPSLDRLIGTEAEVITTIPSNGVGEISYTARQQRFNGPARAVDNREIPTRAVVKIVKIVSNTFYVERTA